MSDDDVTQGAFERSTRLKLDNYAVPDAPRLGARGWLRWMWRQVTSMRVALILLLFLALAAIPGSVLPQWPQNARNTQAYLDNNPTLGPILDALGLLDVFGSAWFTAIYLLLFASLIGCIVPRAFAHGRSMRAPVSAAPSSFARYDTARQRQVTDGASPADVIARAQTALRPHRAMWGALTGYRVRVDDRDGATGRELALAAEKGHIRELGNLLFHVSLVGILVTMALGSLFTYRGQAVIVEGRSFTNAVVAYDSFESGRGFDPSNLQPFTLTVNRLDSAFEDNGRPTYFRAYVTLTTRGGKSAEATITDGQIEVNRPLQVDGAKIYLQGNGFAPVFTVRDAEGNVTFSGSTPFLPQDGVYTSTGVIKVPDVVTGPQIGIKATLLPTAVEGPDGPVSIHPSPDNPVIYFQAYTGDLGLDDGIPQNVYTLDESQLSPVRGENGDVLIVPIRLGETVELPDGLGTVTWDALPRFVALDLRADPTLPWLLAASIGALLGLCMSLFGTRRRVWLVVPLDPAGASAASGEGDADATTVVSGAAYGPAHDMALESELSRALDAAAAHKEDE